ncbi:hypothetical protein HPP92_025233 [Vanilla planifolia]|uniref:Piezo non-specific cation channel R-Ras-binding domain-containing protein n=1 Tax=Vanilla planifolia TaxID=51239 RepID=A0A835PG91_VANPL|nr:hypothetical protein HPP92_025233 [Vanilla planifolia]
MKTMTRAENEDELSFVNFDLEEMDFIMSTEDNGVTEQLLPSKCSILSQASSFRSMIRSTNVLLRESIFKRSSVNFFTYGFPVLLLALSFWCFYFASICAFVLLAYVGYVFYAFPSLFDLQWLNGLLLAFVLLWTICTYVFNVAFTFLNGELGHGYLGHNWIVALPYSGFFLLAQFFLGVLIAIRNLVDNSVSVYLSDVDRGSSNDGFFVEEEEDAKVLVIATIAWGLRKSSRAIALALIFHLALKPGLLHAIYIIFFLLYLLSHSVRRKIQRTLVLFCEMHFSLLYVLRLKLIAHALEQTGSLTMWILSLLGLSSGASFIDLLEIGALLCFSAVQIYGSKVLFSFSAIVQHTPVPPFGFSVLKAGLDKSVLLSVYTSPSSTDCQLKSSKEKLIARYLSDISQLFSSTYHSYGTYVAFLTVLLNVYLMNPNYVSLGYLIFLLFWITGRQLVEETRRRLWFPLKAYAILVFIFTFSLNTCTRFQTFLSKLMHLDPVLGFKSKVSLFENIRQPLAILIVMQLYSYERRQSTQSKGLSKDIASNLGVVGFVRRFLIWHSEKILSAATFYASLSPVSAVGFFYLVGLIVSSALPKASRFPSKFFIVYTTIVVIFLYLFQIWGELLNMFPGQELSTLSLFLGLNKFESGFCGIESGLRGNMLVIISCILQYNVFCWLKSLPSSFVYKSQWEEPCYLFISSEDVSTGTCTAVDTGSTVDLTISSMRQGGVAFHSFPSFQSNINKTKNTISRFIRGSEGGKEKQSFIQIGESSRENQKWDLKKMRPLRKERFQMQKSAIKVYTKFWIENLFKLRGLEINMVVLLLGSFSVLNAISIFYIVCLVVCILLTRDVIRKLWPVFVFSYASILVLEYSAIWKQSIFSTYAPTKTKVHCSDCWSDSGNYPSYCKKCWLGVIVDDPRMLVCYYIVFIFSSFKLRSDHLSNFSVSQTYRQMMFHKKNASVWRDLSFETKYVWTCLDYLRLYTYCHLLDIVLALILITGTLEYDILHLGYLAFALLFFRMRLEILKKKNGIFKYLRIYNFALIVLSLAYQSPYLGNVGPGKYEPIDYIFKIVGFHKYDYGFRITSRSALVEIVIFLLASMQSYIFSSRDFDNVARYLEAEQIGAIVREEEKKAASKSAQLQHIRKSEELKWQRNLQVEKMKSEMLNLQIQLKRMNSFAHVSVGSPQLDGLKRRNPASQNLDVTANMGDNEALPQTQENCLFNEQPNSIDFAVNTPENILLSHQTAGLHDRVPVEKYNGLKVKQAVDSVRETSTNRVFEYVPFSDVNIRQKEKVKVKVNPLISAAQIFGNGVSQVRYLGNQAVTNIASFLNINPEDSDSDGYLSAEDGLNDEMDGQNNIKSKVVPIPVERSVTEAPALLPAPATGPQIRKIFRFIWVQMRSNNDIVCYCCFILVFLWNFSLLSMIYLAALFLYALCVNSGPSYIFWVTMLIYTEFNILLQYLYQIIIQHCSVDLNLVLLRRLGFLSHKITASFVMSTLPLFMVYISTLLQSSITAKDSVWAPIADCNVFVGRSPHLHQVPVSLNLQEGNVRKMILQLRNIKNIIVKSFSRYWRSLTLGSEAPPHFIELSMKVEKWPQDGIQPERIESRVNQVLAIGHKDRCSTKIFALQHSASRVRIQSIEQSKEQSDVALAVFEVIYASPLMKCKEADLYRSLTPAADVTKEILKAQKSGLFNVVNFPYPVISVIGGGRREVDLYAYIFCADLAVFFLVATFYQSIIENKSRFLDVYQFEDQFPKEFVFILMVLFFLIVLDRVIYLCSFATGKVVYYVLSVVLFTYSVVEYAWYMEPSHQVGGFAIRVIFLTKAVSLALQAMQIRHGIPNRSTLYQQFLTTKTTRVTFLGFRLYRALPFLYELRCVLDWSCTSTSLTMYDWLKLEDINASLFLVKCDAVLNRSTHQQGQKQTRMTKFCGGICLLFILICVIWAPMLMYSSGNPTNIANPIKDVSVQVEIKAAGGRLVLFQTTLCELIEWENLNFTRSLDPNRYLDSYNEKDIQLICCQPDASISWLIPPAVQYRFIRSLDVELEIIFSWVFIRDRPKGKEVVKYELYVEHPPRPYEVKKVFNGTADGFRIFDVYPRYFRVTGSGEVRLLEQTVDSVSGDLFLNHGIPSWWSFHDVNASNVKGCEGLTGPMAIVVSEETPQGILGETLSKFSIWSLYLSFVLAVGRFIRLQFSELKMRIPYENLPSCERLIAICEDIYAARAEGELEVEEVLYWTLVKIYRSPHMLLEYTKPD